MPRTAGADRESGESEREIIIHIQDQKVTH